MDYQHSFSPSCAPRYELVSDSYDNFFNGEVFLYLGSTRYCVDKNYAGVLIIWDRMFGTFEPERRDEPLVYGLIEQVDSFNPFYLEVSSYVHLTILNEIMPNFSFQFFYLKKVFEKMQSMSGLTDKLKALFYGPGWFPGSPKLGHYDQLPEVT